MATRTPTTEFVASDRSVIKLTWTGLLNGDSGAPVEFSQYADRSVHISGTFGSGGGVLVEGSNNNEVSYVTLQDANNAALVFAAAGFETIIDLAEKTRPRVTAGDGTTNLTVTILARRA